MKQGTVVGIYLFPERGSAPVEVQEAEATPGIGLKGDQHRHPSRALSLLSKESWQQAIAEVGDQSLVPSTRRANVVISGIDLSQTIGKSLRIGEVEMQVNGETKPCELMDKQRIGLRTALEPEMRGGVNGAVEKPGIIRIGDTVAVLD